MSQLFQHFVFTKFNVKLGWGESVNNLLNEKWHERRFKLFLNYCLPSLANQTNKNFTWLVIFDSDTKAKYRSIISELKNKYRFFYPIFIPHYEYWKANYNEIVNELLDKNTEYLITSRVDNDDCLHKDFIQLVQNHFDKQSYQILNFCNGFSLRINPKTELSKMNFLDGPFCSMIEKIEKGQSFKTIYGQQHSHYLANTNVIQIESPGSWVQIIHGDNISNTLSGIPLKNTNYLAEFGIDDKKLKIALIPFLKAWSISSIKTWTPTAVKNLVRKIAS